MKQYKDLTNKQKEQVRDQLWTLREHEQEKELSESEVDFSDLDNCYFVDSDIYIGRVDIVL